MIPQLLLEEILNGEKNEKDFYTKYGKEELQAALAELKKSNKEILSAYPAEAMKSEIIKNTFHSLVSFGRTESVSIIFFNKY